MTSLLAVIPRTIPGARKALAAMAADIDNARTYEAIRSIERAAEAMRLLFAEVEEVRHEAESIVVLANHRIGRELASKPVAKGGRPEKTGTSKGPVFASLKDQVGSKNAGLRLKRLASIDRDEVARTIDRLHSSGKDATVSAVLKEVRGDDKSARRAERERMLATKIMALPDRRYGVILGDPEWRFEPWSRATGLDRAPQYPTSCTEIIAARDVPSIAANDCALFLCATAPMLPHALVVMAAWGFDYATNWELHKDRIITGYWNRNRHEHLLLGVRGHVPCPAPGEQWDSVIEAPVGRHSEKPDAIREMIEAYFPNIPKIELNRIGPPRPGWDAWGDEAEAA